MKEYNRKTRKWEEKTTEQVGELKKKELCRGGNAHKMVLVLPSYLKMDSLPIEIIEKYYESEQRIADFKVKEIDYQNSLGIFTKKYKYELKVTRYLRCEVCGKKDI